MVACGASAAIGNAGDRVQVEQPNKFDLFINLKTANALGLTVPPTLLAYRRGGDQMEGIEP